MAKKGEYKLLISKTNMPHAIVNAVDHSDVLARVKDLEFADRIVDLLNHEIDPTDFMELFNDIEGLQE